MRGTLSESIASGSPGMKYGWPLLVLAVVAIGLLQVHSGKEQRGMGTAAEVSQDTFEQEVLKSDVPVLVDFWAPWCGPCRMLAPIVDELGTDYAGKLKVVKVNTDQNNSLAGEYGVRGIPTLNVFKDGKEVERVVGVQPKKALAEKIDGAIGS